MDLKAGIGLPLVHYSFPPFSSRSLNASRNIVMGDILSQELIQNGDDNSNTVVSLGNGQHVSMQIVQDMYNEITGKKEKLTRNYTDHHKTDLSDLRQLNEKMIQMCEQYQVIQSNCNVTMYHTDDVKQQFSSFERFALYDMSSTSPVENIRLNYNFLIKLPKTDNIQTYSVSINLHSRSAINARAEAEHGASRRIFRIMSPRTGTLEIEYVDYLVAFAFKTTIDKWFDGLKKSKENKFINTLQDNSHHIHAAFKLITTVCISTIFFLNSEEILSAASNSLDLFKVGLVAIASLSVCSDLAARLGMAVSDAIDHIQPISYLKLTKGDSATIQKQKEDTWKIVRGGVYSSIGVIALNVISNYLIQYLS